MTKEEFAEFIKKANKNDWDNCFTGEEDNERIEVYVIDKEYEYGYDDSFNTYYSADNFVNNMEQDILNEFDLSDIVKIEIWSKGEDSINDMLEIES